MTGTLQTLSEVIANTNRKQDLDLPAIRYIS